MTMHVRKAQAAGVAPDRQCTLCNLSLTCKTVCLLSTDQRSEVMIIGEAPGRNEDREGKPFVGESGKYLNMVLEQVGIDRKKCYVTNAVSCRPPDNRTPSKKEIKACKVWLDRQINWVKPKFVLLLGNTPLISITGESGIKRKRGKPFEKDGILYFPTYHPAYIARMGLASAEEQAFYRDMRSFAEIVENGGLLKEKDLNVCIIDNRTKFRQLLRDLKGTVSIDIEGTGLYPWGTPVFFKADKKNKKDKTFSHLEPNHITSLGFGTERTQYVIPIKAEAWECPFDDKTIRGMLDEIDDELQNCIVVGHNGKFDFLWLWVHYGLKWYEYFDFDTMLAHYILDENDFHGLDHLAKKYFGAPAYDVPLTLKQGRSGTLIEHAEYLGLDCFYTRKLRFALGKELRQDKEVKLVFDEIMMPCARLFVEVEYDGVYLDLSKMNDAERYLKNELAEAEKSLIAACKKERVTPPENWGSSQQLAKFLFTNEGLGLEVIERTAKGAASTSESVLKRIDHPVGAALIRFRGARQQMSFFIEGWKPFIVNRLLHPSFKLHGTVTGRLSCEHPNLQQVPRDVRIRQLITAPPGWTLIEADLSQIELRIAAELAQEPTMLDAFRRGIDVHWLTATRELERGGGGKHVDTIIRTAEAYLKREGKPKKLRFAEAMEIVIEKVSPGVAEELQKEWGETDPEMLWKEIRKKAKAVNFGYLYGMWWKKFKIYARDNYGVDLTDAESEESRTFFFATYPVFAKWHKRQRRYANINGYVRSLSGRKRRLPAATDHVDTPERREAERQAINSPVQSFANELNLMSALQLRKEFPRDTVRLVGTVHDSLLAWVKNDAVDRVVTRLLTIMSRPQLMDKFEIDLGVPVMAEAKIGAWGVGMDFHKWQKQNASTRRSSRNDRGRPRSTSRASSRGSDTVSRHSRDRHSTSTGGRRARS